MRSRIGTAILTQRRKTSTESTTAWWRESVFASACTILWSLGCEVAYLKWFARFAYYACIRSFGTRSAFLTHAWLILLYDWCLFDTLNPTRYPSNIVTARDTFVRILGSLLVCTQLRYPSARNTRCDSCNTRWDARKKYCPRYPSILVVSTTFAQVILPRTA